MKWCFFLLLCCLAPFARAQTPIVVTGVVYDSLAQEACPFVRIYNHRRAQGVLTDIDGRFEIPVDSPQDSITLSSPGYRSQTLLAGQLIRDTLTLLQPEGSVLDELIVLADDHHLYRWMDAVFAAKLPDKTAKTYMEVETFLDGTQVEMVEAYYNGKIRGGDIRSLEYKNGRMALTRAGNTSFLSTETSKAILQLRLNEGNDNLPDTPFEYPVKKIRKKFKLELNKTYRSQRGHAVYVISFAPRDPEENAFSGTIWLDTVTKQALKLTLHAQRARVHPFVPLFPDDTIVSVGLELNYVFREESAAQQLDFIYFDYRLDYQNRNRDRYDVVTNVIVHPYNYDAQFVLPYFKTHNMRHSDYRNIQAFPYNDRFWEWEEHPISQESAAHNRQFFNNREVLYNSDSVSTFRINESKHGFFESPYRFWSQQRITILNSLPPEQMEGPDKRYAMPAAEKYELVVQLYMDLNYHKDQPYIITATILDPYETFYYLPKDSTTDCFLNLCMDIVEIQRRKFEQRIQAPGYDIRELNADWGRLQTTVQSITMQFFSDVNHGSYRRGMEKWNAYVLKELGIDNFAYFRLYKSPPLEE